MKLSLPTLPLTIGRVTVYPDRNRSEDDPWGRFGGGWQFRLGITAGRWDPARVRTVLVGLGIREYRVEIAPRGAVK
ncbi:hypothetical protein SEA_BUMBLE_68 [Arthrobacter phage Bumble]